MLALEGMMNAQRNRGMSLGAPTLSLSADHTRSTDVVSKKSKSLTKKSEINSSLSFVTSQTGDQLRRMLQKRGTQVHEKRL